MIDPCDDLICEAAVLGAVNTLVFSDDRIFGENTDWSGFSWMIAQEFGDIAGCAVAQIGADGAGSATALGLARLGASEVALYDPQSNRAAELVERLSPHYPNCRFKTCLTAAAAIDGRNGIVNASSYGQAVLGPNDQCERSVMLAECPLSGLI